MPSETSDGRPATAQSGVHKVAATIPGDAIAGDAAIERTEPASSPPMSVLVERLSPEVITLLDEMASSEGVPRSFVVSVAIKALYRSKAWR